MFQTMTATVENGRLKPDQPLDLPPGTRVHLTVHPLHSSEKEMQQAADDFDQLCEELSVDDGGPRLTRDQLHERR